MGSLMAGWASPVMDENIARARRNRSLTKEEINTFWKTQKKSDEDDGSELGSPSFGSPPKSPVFSKEMGKRRAVTPLSRAHNTDTLTQTQSAPSSPHGTSDEPPEEISGKPDKTGDWWTRSNWAFLNEPPRDEMYGSAHKYTPQFHVAHLATGHA